MRMLEPAMAQRVEAEGEHTASDDSLFPLSAHSLSLTIDGVRLLDGIDLDLNAGQISMVMGANGAGKTVLLRVLHGLEQPTSGRVTCGMQEVSQATRRRQAMVFQKPVLLRRSVRANIEFVIGLSGKPDPDRCNQLLESVALLARADQPARLLSGGEQQRLALARALATNPEVLFLDEPTASLDPASLIQIETAVLAAHQRGIKIVFVTHDLAQARRMADEIVFLHHGRVEEQSDADSFFSCPASEAARAYVEGRILV